MSDDEFVAIFHDEARERVASIVETLLAVEAGTAKDDAVDALFRDAHTIKGAASMLGLEPIRAVAHALEDVLQQVRESGGIEQLTEPLLRAADALAALVEGEAPRGGVIEELRAAQPAASPAAPSGDESQRPAVAVDPPRRSIRVASDTVDQLLDLSGEAVLQQRRLGHRLAGAGDQVDDELQLGTRLLDELQQTTLRMRMLPLSAIAGPFARAVRDAAASMGKEAEFVLVGGETELDRVLLETLPEPLAHLLRNAVAHGVEMPERRLAAGKPRHGTVELRGEQRGRLVTFTVSDDGAGVDRGAVARAGDGSLADVLADPGFSTAAAVSDLAGRGVGLDAVKRQVEAVGGSLEVTSEPGRGTAVSLTLPLTLALLEVLLVERGGAMFGLPLGAVEETVAADAPMAVEGRQALAVRGQAVPYVDLAAVLAFTAPPVAKRRAVVIAAAGRRVAIGVDRALTRDEVVVKSLGGLLGELPAYLGAAVLGSGRVALLLDASWLVRQSATVGRGAAPGPAVPAGPPATVLVVEDSMTVRELQRSILESAGYRVVTARHGGEALERIESDADIDLVVTDVEMPELDGLALTRAIRAHPDRSTLPVVIVTSRGADEDRRLGIEAGADAYVVKRTYDQQALLDTVAALLAR